jgi:hypothetical protein
MNCRVERGKGTRRKKQGKGIMVCLEERRDYDYGGRESVMMMVIMRSDDKI